MYKRTNDFTLEDALEQYAKGNAVICADGRVARIEREEKQ